VENRNLHHIFRATVLAAAIAALPGAANAAGLGKITVLSALGQPLRAEVDLTANREELSSLKAQIAPAEAFRQAGIEYAPALVGVRVSVEKRPNGQPYIRLTSDRPINDPFLDLLLEVNWAQGRLQREYTFLLDPPAEAITPAPVAVTPGARRDTAAVAQPVAPQAQPQVRAPAPVDDKLLAKKPEKPAAAAAEHEVKKGETLHKIASETRYDGVSLDQMLVAIFRNNQDAFVGKNMNRLKAGKILSIPERQDVEAIEPADAQRIVRAQSADFNAYRRKLAEAAGAAEPAKEAAPQQTASGKITAKVEDKVPAPAESQDQLKVSRSEAGKEAKALQGKLAALEEEAVAKEKAFKEATSRLAELEKNVKELQKLLELKNQNLAELQKQAAAGVAAPAAAKPEAPAPVAPAPKAEDVKPVPAAEKPAEPAPAAEPPKPAEAAPAPVAAAPAADKPAEAPKPAEQKPVPPKKPAAPPPPPEPGFLDALMENPLVLAGGAAILGLLGLLGWRQRQKGTLGQAELSPTTTSVNLATNSVFGSTGGQSVDTSASSMQTDFSQASISAIDADEGVDPVAEADVYMAYGRDAQAEEILLDALKNDPSRTAIHVKLLEIYAGRKNVKQFETIAGELYAQTGGVGADWEKAAALGLKLDPGNPLYGGKAAEEGAPAPQAAAADTTIIVSSPEKLKDTWTMPGELSQIAGAAENPGAAATVVPDKAAMEAAATGDLAPALDFDLDLGEPAAQPAAASAAEAPQTLDFDLGLDFPAAPKQETAPAPAAEASLDLDFKLPELPETAAGADGGLHFDLELSPARATPGAETTLPTGSGAGFEFDLGESPASATPKPAAPVDLSAIDLNLEQPEAVLEAPEFGTEDEQEVATKLELAKAYEEMGDREGARELLQEVVKEGDAEQQKRARDMLAALA
jgi:pilus assembly protein FimV